MEAERLADARRVELKQIGLRDRDVRRACAHTGVLCVISVRNDHVVAVVPAEQEYANQRLIVRRRLRVRRIDAVTAEQRRESRSRERAARLQEPASIEFHSGTCTKYDDAIK